MPRTRRQTILKVIINWNPSKSKIPTERGEMTTVYMDEFKTLEQLREAVAYKPRASTPALLTEMEKQKSHIERNAREFRQSNGQASNTTYILLNGLTLRIDKISLHQFL